MISSLRPYLPKDFETLFAIDQACYPRGIAYSRRMLRDFLSFSESDCIVAESGAETSNELAGFILTEAEAARGHIITIDVLEQFRRAGLGTRLLLAAEVRLSARGVRQVELETATNNEPAIAFWLKHGYRTRGSYKRYYLGRVDALAMLKALVPPKES